MKIFLLGYMCSGKSTLGPRLSGCLDIPFLDLDTEIEKAEGNSISRIFEEKGEEHFRRIEKTTLANLIRSVPDFVMATGGGTPCFFNNMELMKKNGVTIYLDVPVKELVRRNIRTRERRPLLRRMSDLEMQSFITSQLKERSVFYKKANKTMRDENPDLDLLEKEIRLMAHSR